MIAEKGGAPGSAFFIDTTDRYIRYRQVQGVKAGNLRVAP